MAILGFKLYMIDNGIYKSITKELSKEFNENNNNNVIVFCVFFDDGSVIPVTKSYDYYWADFINENFGYEDEDDMDASNLKIAKPGLKIIDMKNFNFIFNNAIRDK